MDAGRPDESVLASLRELRAIEQQRLAEERAAVEAAIAARRRDRDTAAQVARDAEAARIAAERDAQLAAEAARAEVERQARLHIEAAEAAERARHLIALEARRFDEEMALRREVAKRQRPRWMIALTGLAVAAAIGLGGFAVQRQRESAAAEQARARAQQAQTEAQREARDAQAEVDKLAQELAALDAKIAATIERVIKAQTAAELQAAADTLREERREQAEIREQQRRREEERKKKERQAPVVISPDCLNNPVCRDSASTGHGHR
jgi:hypothetical protein